MIKSHCFQKEWIDILRAKPAWQRINPPLVEKMIHAFSLLQNLQEQGLDFVFKGGTSLVLLLDSANRFSIDIDIVTAATRETIEHHLSDIIADSVFTKWELGAHRSYQPGIPKAHYKLNYNSAYNKSGYVLLDILFEKQHYPIIEHLPIQSHWFETQKITLVKVPSIESITGDKLTAFAPGTTGIPFGVTKELEIIKQLFDLSALFDQVRKLEIVAASYSAFVRQEILYRNLDETPANVLWDTIHTCRMIGFKEGNKNQADRSRYADFRKGIQSFDSHLVTGNFHIDEAVTAAAKVAYLCIRLLVEDYSELPRYTGQNIEGSVITNPDWNTLNKLKKFKDQTSFYYWFAGLRLLGFTAAPVNPFPTSPAQKTA